MRSHAAGTEASGATTAGTGAGGGELATVVRHSCKTNKPFSTIVSLHVWSATVADAAAAFAFALALLGMSVAVLLRGGLQLIDYLD